MQHTALQTMLRVLPAALIAVFAQGAFADASTDVAPADGWAGQNGGTKGGSAAVATRIFTVSTPKQLIAAIKASGTTPRIVKVVGTIDMASADNGGPFTSHTDQSDRGEIHLNSNTTLIGVGSTAKIVNGVTKVYHINNVIIRNLTIVNPCDITPVWDPSDGPTGNWNSEFDGVVVDGSKNVWIDHMNFTDAPLTDDKLPIENGKTKQCHDGSLDIKNGADFVTVSNSIFELHDKNNLVGAGDGKTTDEGHLAITFKGNMWRDITQRAPRVRFGKVHVVNNYFVGSKTHPVYPNIYSIGVGKAAKIISENNAFEITGAAKCDDIVVNPLSTSPVGNFKDAGSTLNGTVLSGCSVPNAVTWTIPYSYTKLATSAVKASVLANAGVGKIGF